MTSVVVIGAYGSAGVAAAERLADAGVDLTLVDDGEPGGGLCILRGCMPSKEVLSATAHRYQARHDHRLAGDPPPVDLEAVVQTKDGHVADFAAHRRAAVDALAERDHVEFRHETARFIDDRTVQIGEDRFTPDYVVVATGSTVDVPDLPGLDSVDYWTSNDVLDATSLPESGVVMGFGYVGLELVPYLGEAGMDEVTVIEHDDRPLDEADPVYGDTLLDLYQAEFGIEILTNTYEESVESTEQGVRLHVDGPVDSVEADVLFLFTGRRPAVDSLGLEVTSLEVDDGWVQSTMQARDDDRIFVVGDVNGREPILHVAKEQGLTAAENLLAHAAGQPVEPYEHIHHHVVFSGAAVYPYARVGMTGQQAAETDRDVVVATREASDDGIFKTKAVPRGRATLIADATDGTVMGYQGLHYHADSMAKTMQVIVELGLDVRELPDRAYHPTLPEILDGLFREASERIRG